MDELSIRASNYDVIGITETWGSCDISDAELSLSGFQMFRVDRATRGGGVVLYVSEKYEAVLAQDIDTGGFRDCVWCRLCLQEIKLIIGVCYRSTASSVENDEALLSMFSSVASLADAGSCTVIMGDFNLPSIDFKRSSVEGSADSFAGRVFDCLLDNFWYQHVTDFTRFRENQTPSCLDWIITDDPNVLEELTYLEPIGKSDHVCISWHLCFANRPVTCESKFNYWKADYPTIREKLSSINWSSEFDNKSVNDMWKYFTSVIETCVSDSVPLYKQKVSKKKSPWLSRDSKAALRQRKKAWLEYVKNKSSERLSVYKSLRNRVVRSIRKDKSEYQKQLVRRMKSCPRMFYKYVRSKQRNTVTVKSLKKADGNISQNDKESADVLCQKFQEVFTDHGITNLKSLMSACNTPNNGLSAHDLFTEDVVYKKLCLLNPAKSPGPDALHPHLLKSCADILVAPLTCIFQKSFTDSCLPDDWKSANITPLFKKGSKSDPDNYRPVSLTCVSCKIMESIIRDYVAEVMMNSGLLSTFQHGFVKGKSCATNLLTAFETWTKWMDEGYGVDIVYLDYRKAFDSVNHAKLIEKLMLANVDLTVIKWIAAFLLGRKMRVKVRMEFSDWVLVLSGVPQGSVLGPLLFLVFINDLPQWIKNSMLLLFADDTKVYRKISENNDEILLQSDLDSLVSWTKEWCLKFNVDKCKVMRVAHTGQHQYVLDGVKLQEVQQERDLGVEVSSSLKPSLQCTKAAAKAMQVLGIIKRNFVMNDEEDFRLLFNGYVRPHLEYCVQVWNPYLKKDIECLEKVQRRATKLVKGLKNRPYSERLALLRTSSLEKRRWRGDLIQAYRIVKGIDKVNVEHFFEIDDGGGHDLRGHNLKVKVQRSRLQLRQGFFSQRVVCAWNSLPSSVVEASSVKTFKKRLDDWSQDVDL